MALRTDTFQITDAQVPLSEDQGGRTRKYLVSMGIRTICFIGAVLADGWLRWVLVAGAVGLPYLAVVIANAGRESPRGNPTRLVVHEQTSIASSPHQGEQGPGSPPGGASH